MQALSLRIRSCVYFSATFDFRAEGRSQQTDLGLKVALVIVFPAQ